jgi:catechol 2,3-dioxygenase-like lactoylglutathione lyase family enzyme
VEVTPMFNPIGVTAMIPCSDLARAEGWYAEKLGLKPMGEDEGGAYYSLGDTRFALYPSQFVGTAQSTAMTFDVEDVDDAVQTLKGNGVTFEEYDLGEWGKTIEGILTAKSADAGEFKNAWFKDPDGNILAISDLVSKVTALRR